MFQLVNLKDCLVRVLNSLPPGLNHINIKIQIKFDGSCLKQEKMIFTYKKVVNIYIISEINLWLYIQF